MFVDFLGRPTSHHPVHFRLSISTQLEGGVCVCPWALCVSLLTRKTSDLQGHFLAEWGLPLQGLRELAPAGPGAAGRRTQARCSPGVVVNAGTYASRSGALPRCECQEEKVNTHLGPGSPSEVPGTRGGAQRGGKCQRPHEMPWRRKALPFRLRLPGEGAVAPSLKAGIWER